MYTIVTLHMTARIFFPIRLQSNFFESFGGKSPASRVNPAILVSYIMQESFISYLPKNYIRDREIHEESACTICLQLKLSMARCRGPCKKPICLSCVAKIKYEKDACPSRCSIPFQIQTISQLGIVLACPYAPELCKEIIKTADQFRWHCQRCGFMNEEQRKESKHKQQYKCQKGHLLTFLTDQNYKKVFKDTGLSFYQHTCREVCSICNEQSNIRSVCLQCSSSKKLVQFCVTCRPLPCSKSYCPIGHPVVVQQAIGYAMICDLCGQPAKFNGKIAYEDAACNYDICQRCYNNLPEQNPLIPLQNVIHEFQHEQVQQQHLSYENMIEQFRNQLQNLQNYEQMVNQLQILQRQQEEQSEIQDNINVDIVEIDALHQQMIQSFVPNVEEVVQIPEVHVQEEEANNLDLHQEQM